MGANKLTRYKGDTYSVEAVLTKGNTPVDLTPSSNTATLSFSAGNVSVSIPGTSGSINGEVSFPFPADVKTGSYKYDIQVTAVNTGEIRTYVKDVLEIINDITK